MNKKFSTLVAGLLLASAVSVQAADVWPLAAIGTNQATISAVQPYANGAGGYEVGKAYLLGDGTNVLSIEEGSVAGQFTLKYKAVGTYTKVDDLYMAMWQLREIVAPAGAVAPKYVFVNMYTGTVLALNTANAIAYDNTTAINNWTSTILGGDITEWLSASSYKDPYNATNAVYASLDNDYAVGIAYKSDGNVYLVKYPKASASSVSALIKIRPYSASGLVLSANELNTLMGKMGRTATADSYFQLSMSPALTADNVFDGVDVQAQAIQQYELMKDEKTSSAKVNTYSSLTGTNIITTNSYYASLYPYSKKTVGSDAYKDLVNPDNVNAWSNEDAQYVALKTKSGKYVVVDTAYIAGTDNNQQGLIKLTTDDLYNAKNQTKYRHPNSYLFKFVYNATEGTVDVTAARYVKKSPAKTTTGISDDTYYSTYGQKPYKEASWWWDETNVVVDGAATPTATQFTRALLGNNSHLTLAKASDGDQVLESNKLAISLVPSSAYRPTSLASGAYLIKIVDVAKPENAANIGKYWVANMKGGFEIMEQAVRQNFQDMPAAQWVVESNGTVAGSPVTITNREFGKELEGDNKFPTHAGVLYATEGGKCFFDGDVLEFIPVEDAMNEYLGYNYLTEDQLKDNTYTFNYLHDLAMDKPLNTKSDKDSVVWVDANDATTAFTLEPVITDSYGYNGGLKNVAKLKRVVYYIKVKDATKLQNDGRYLTYNGNLKKYVVSTFTPNIKNTGTDWNNNSNPDAFFLKENNEVAGANCYYTLVKANIVPVVTSLADHDAKYMVLDSDINGKFYARKKDNVTINGVNQGDQWYAYYRNGNTWAVVTDEANANQKIANVVNSHYSEAKVSVDNNTLDLVNGVLNNGSLNEVANSAFAVKPVDRTYYRTLTDEETLVKFYRINSTDKEYLYEDANSKYSAAYDFNFLGVEGKGDAKKAAMFIDTAIVSNTRMPQYLIFVNPSVVAADTILCDATNHSHATLAEALACDHSKVTKAYVTGRLLVNLADSAKAHKDDYDNMYLWNKQYTRLGFVEATHMGNEVIIGEDKINLADNKHKNVAFSFRLIDETDNFLIESEGDKIVPSDGKGGWIKIQNGVPVIAKYSSYNEAAQDAEVFNLEATDEKPTANEEVAASEVSVVAVQGAIIVKGAAGKVVTVANILGQTIANQVAASDNVTIAAPAGVAVVTVDGEATKVVVK